MKSKYSDYYIAALIVFIFSFLALVINLPSQKYFRRDEVNFSRVSVYSFRTFFIEKDFTDIGWSKPFNTFGFYNPQIGKYIIGSSMWVHKFRSFNGVAKWNPNKDIKWHIEQGIVPSPDKLFAARLPIAFLASGTAVLLFVLGSLLTESYSRKLSISMGLLTVLLFFLHPLAWQFGHRAMLDMPALFFTTFAITSLVLSGRYFIRGMASQGVLWGLSASFMIGLGIATKLNALLVWGVIFSCYTGATFYFFYQKKYRFVKLILFLLGIHFLIPLVIFVITNPFLYQDTFLGIQRMLEINSMVSNQPDHLATLIEKMNSFIELGIGFIESWSQTKLIDALLLIGGGIIMPISIYKKKHDKQFVVTGGILLFWIFVMGIGLLLWIPMPWGRYYLPWMPASALLEAFAIWGMLTLLNNQWKKYIYSDK